MSLRIATIQMNAASKQLPRAEVFLNEARSLKADFCLFPELMAWPWLPAQDDPALRSRAEPADGPTLTALRELAAKYGVNVLAPLYESAGEEKYDTTFVLSRSGAILGRYRKNHIPHEPGGYERSFFAPGNEGFPVFEHEGLRFGIQICWDNMFPEGTRSLALDGARVVFAPRATGGKTLTRWNTVLSANAAVNTLFIVAANRVGEDSGLVFGGGACIIDPFGRTVSNPLPAGLPGLVVAEIDPGEVELARREEPFLANRRPEIYSRLVRENGDRLLPG
jgi:N-carbamoylputrescine amidase